jgi:hypothetical protein
VLSARHGRVPPTSRAMLRGWTTFRAPSRVGGVVAGDFFWIFRGFTECAAELTFAQHLGWFARGLLVLRDRLRPAGVLGPLRSRGWAVPVARG